MCAIAKVGQNTVQPGSSLFIRYNGGTDMRDWGYAGLYNARVEGLDKVWKKYERVYTLLDGFYEGGQLFDLKTGKAMSIAAVSDGEHLFIVTRNAVDLVKPYHGRMPVILADPNSFIFNNQIKEIDYSLLKRA